MQQTNLTIRLTKKEKATLQKLAHIDGKSMTDYIKFKIFDTQEFPKEEVQKQNGMQSESIISYLEKYLQPMLKTVLTNNGIMRLTVGKEISEQDKESLKNEINDKVAKLFEVK
jgi:hypothetical protein